MDLPHAIHALLAVSERIPRLPKVSLKLALPLLPYVIQSPSTIMLLRSCYKIYCNTQGACDTVRQPFEYYLLIQDLARRGYRLGCKVTGQQRYPQHFTSKEEESHWRSLCEGDSSEWILLFPDDEHHK
jgi:hypothetical protein